MNRAVEKLSTMHASSWQRFWKLLKFKTKQIIVKYVHKIAKLPWIYRISIAVLLCIGGVLGFLPILGFWMLPLGIIAFGLCLPFTDRLIDNWVRRIEAELNVERNLRKPF